jgi:hypothetical protein
MGILYKTKRYGLFYSGQTLDYKQIRAKNFERSIFDEILPPPYTDDLLHYSKFERIASSFTEVKIQGIEKGTGHEGDIFTGSTQLMKAIAYSLQTRINRIGKRPSKVIIFILPIIVFEGPLYEATLGANTKLIIKPSNHILLERQSRLPFTGDEEQSFLIDIVAKDYFEHFLNFVEKDIHNIERAIVSKRRKLLRRS